MFRTLETIIILIFEIQFISGFGIIDLDMACVLLCLNLQCFIIQKLFKILVVLFFMYTIN